MKISHLDLCNLVMYSKIKGQGISLELDMTKKERSKLLKSMKCGDLINKRSVVAHNVFTGKNERIHF